MNKAQRNWIKALRSGKFKQATGGFKVTADDDIDNVIGHCCLGVYCEVQGYDIDMDHGDHDDLEGAVTWGLVAHLDDLPPEDLTMLGFHNFDTNALVAFNDTVGFSFDLIADILEHTFQDGTIDVLAAVEELGYLDLVEHVGIRFPVLFKWIDHLEGRH